MGSKKFYSFAEKVIDLRKKYIGNEIDIDEIWNNLISCSKDINGLGTVYLITILYFITKGNKPIYDRYAMASLSVLKLHKLHNDIKVCKDSIIRGWNLPLKSEINDGIILEKDSIYGQYCSLLEEFFPNNKWKDRDVDRALWVYGHYFRVV